ncbi:MAG: hypothetical protein JST30_12675 [Armatimonadetes bacterium]|nr:hypothetical protein [Armatimonadota bacterium]
MPILHALVALAAIASPAQEAAAHDENGKAKLWICKDTDDDWKPVGATGDPEKHEKGKPPVYTWKADEPFNILVKNPKGVKFGGYLGFVVHKQNADLTDGDFIDERMIESADDSTMWASTEGMFKVPAGTYNVWIIRWDQRDVNYHSGNFKKYLAKVTLKVN